MTTFSLVTSRQLKLDHVDNLRDSSCARYSQNIVVCRFTNGAKPKDDDDDNVVGTAYKCIKIISLHYCNAEARKTPYVKIRYWFHIVPTPCPEKK